MADWTTWWYPPLAALAVTTGVNLVGRGYTWAKEARRVDHGPIRSGWYANPSGLDDHLRVYVACAPSRSPSRPIRISGSQAERFVAGTFPGVAGERVQAIGSDFCRFEDDDLDRRSTIQIWSSGKIEAAIILPVPELAQNGPIPLPLATACSHFISLAFAAQSGEVRRLLGITSRERLDWYFGVSQRWTTLSTSTLQEWKGIAFPGRTPLFAAQTLVTPLPGPGLASLDLQSQRQSADGRWLLRQALADLLADVGYQDFDDAITDVIAESVERSRSIPGGNAPPVL